MSTTAGWRGPNKIKDNLTRVQPAKGVHCVWRKLGTWFADGRKSHKTQNAQIHKTQRVAPGLTPAGDAHDRETRTHARNERTHARTLSLSARHTAVISGMIVYFGISSERRVIDTRSAFDAFVWRRLHAAPVRGWKYGDSGAGEGVGRGRRDGRGGNDAVRRHGDAVSPLRAPDLNWFGRRCDAVDARLL